MHSLSDLYTLINTSNEASPISSVYQAPSEVAPTMNTLEEIYTKTKTEIDLMKANGANKILTGNTFFGVAGTASAGPATLTWQDPDPALNLCWSYNTYEIESGNCSVGSGFTQTPDTLTTLGAVEYCKYLNANGTTLANTAQNIWHLPTIQEYSSITDYTRFNSATAVTGFAVDSLYWSGTEVAGDPYYAWYWGTDGGDTSYVDEVDNYSVRCAH